MRLNEHHMKLLAKNLTNTTREGWLLYRRNKQDKSSYKSRYFKLTANLLLYFRSSDHGEVADQNDPLGLIVLEACHVRLEPYPDRPFVFSLSLDGEGDRQHFFSGDSMEQCQEWMGAMQQATYDLLRAQVVSLQRRLKRVTGKDAVDAYKKKAFAAIRGKAKFTSYDSSSYAPQKNKLDRAPGPPATMKAPAAPSTMSTGKSMFYGSRQDEVPTSQTKPVVPVPVPRPRPKNCNIDKRHSVTLSLPGNLRHGMHEDHYKRIGAIHVDTTDFERSSLPNDSSHHAVPRPAGKVPCIQDPWSLPVNNNATGQQTAKKTSPIPDLFGIAHTEVDLDDGFRDHFSKPSSNVATAAAVDLLDLDPLASASSAGNHRNPDHPPVLFDQNPFGISRGVSSNVNWDRVSPTMPGHFDKADTVNSGATHVQGWEKFE